MAAFAENFDLDFLRKFYDICEVKSLVEFLLPGHSLCIIHDPEWREFREREHIYGRVRLVTVRGHNRKGEPDELLLGICGPEDQGYYRHKLDQNLKSSFLFATWKRGTHEFKMIHGRQTLACFFSLDETTAAYFPNGFIPDCYLESKPPSGKPVYDPETLYIGDDWFE